MPFASKRQQRWAFASGTIISQRRYRAELKARLSGKR